MNSRVYKEAQRLLDVGDLEALAELARRNSKSSIRARRRALDLSQDDLARLSGFSASLIGMIERGYRPTDETIAKIKEILTLAEDI